MQGPGSSSQATRFALRDATQDMHAVLDARMSALDLSIQSDYAAFLAIQYGARVDLEACVSAKMGDDAPPSMLPLLADDLAVLNRALPGPGPEFAQPAQADPLGIAYVLAGSHLGNRMMLRDLDRRAAAGLPRSFLADERMAAYWHALRPRLEAIDNTAPAVAGARAAFLHFAAVADTILVRIAA